jgi:hypothetical protein
LGKYLNFVLVFGMNTSLWGEFPKSQIFCDGPIMETHCKKNKSELGKYPQIINMDHIILIHKVHPRNISYDFILSMKCSSLTFLCFA